MPNQAVNLAAPRFKKIYLLDLPQAAANDGYVGKTLLVASDDNFPFSNGRARSRGADRRGPLAADDTERVLVRLGTPFDADPRLLPPAVK